MVIGIAWLLVMFSTVLTIAVNDAKEYFFDEPEIRRNAKRERERKAEMDAIEHEIGTIEKE